MTRGPSRPARGLALGVAHEVGMATALSASVALVLLGGELRSFAWLVAVAPWLGAALSLVRVQVPAISGTLIALGGLLLGVSTFAQGGPEMAVLAATELILGLVAGRALVRRTPAHDAQAVALSLLLVLASSVLNVSLSFMPLFVVYAIAVVWALATRQLLAGATVLADPIAARARRDVVTPAFFAGTAVVSVGVLASAVMVFLLFPRVGLGDIGGFVRRQDKLPAAVGLRGDPRAVGGTTVVARIEGLARDTWADGLYLRGVVYDVVTLEGFSQSERRALDRKVRLELAGSGRSPQRYTVTATPAVGDRVLVLGSANAARTLRGGRMNASGHMPIVGRTSHDELRTASPIDAPLRYEVLGTVAHPGEIPPPPRDPPAELDPAQPDDARWFTLPAAFDDPLRALAQQAAGDSDDVAQVARQLRTFLLGQFSYGLDPPRFADQPLRAFLLEDRRGHCEFFAAAYALLLRSRGIAARVVGGYQGGAWDDGVVVFQDRHAHAWVEWFHPGLGWVVDDATPLAGAVRTELGGIDTLVERVRRLWDDQVLDFAFEDQMIGLTHARRLLRRAPIGVAVGGVLAIAAITFVVRRLRRRARSGGAAMAPLARAIARCVGGVTRQPVLPASTLREAVLAVPAGHAAQPVLWAALADYERGRFAEEPLPAALVSAHLRALQNAADRSDSAT